MIHLKLLKAATFVGTIVGLSLLVYRPDTNRLTDLPNRMPEAAPYITAEATAFPPPYEDHWQSQDHPGQCQNCHKKIFEEWNGSMMSNAWRDPTWRGAFLYSARPSRWHAAGQAEPLRQTRRVRIGVRYWHGEVYAVPAGLASRRLLLALPYADQLPGQRSAAQY
jgi:hypothetical protein